MDLAYRLAEAGLKPVNVSLDTLKRERFMQIVGADAFERVWNGVIVSERAGLAPIKLNLVALRGINDDEVNAFADLTYQHAWHMRFIELMPVGEYGVAQEFFHRHFISAYELMSRFSALVPVDTENGNGPARIFRLPGASGTVGFITPASQHFCAGCNRIRVTSHGTVRPCLFGADEIDLRALPTDAALVRQLSNAIHAKPERHQGGDEFQINAHAMSEIGG